MSATKAALKAQALAPAERRLQRAMKFLDMAISERFREVPAGGIPPTYMWMFEDSGQIEAVEVKP